MFEVLKKCFDINLNDYENIKFDLEINKVILGAFAVLMIGIVYLSFYRGSIRAVVMQLMRHNADSEEDAKTLGELGLDKSWMVKRLFSGNNILTKTVARVGEKKYEYEEYKALSKAERRESEKIDFAKAKFYISEENKDRAMNIVDRYVTSIPRTVASCVFIAIICVSVIACMPELLNLINNLLESAKK
ncbi:MAG: hypothetical protein IJW53_02015 [Clostridia bacterium]|nr:hypothetical protein [Clostridia bacterium]